ncbi:MAG: T9SS type A sorting domain-containing protein [Chitinophagales bacterium]
MKFFSLSVLLLLCCSFLRAQQPVNVISRCGGTETVFIPGITDNDGDGMSDVLENKLLQHFMPTFIQFSDESCPGPALDGTGDSNLVVCRIFPIPQQYSLTNNLNSVLTQPVPVVGSKQLTPGLVWYNPLVMVNAALLYGQDCGALGHTADVEGFSFSLRYIGADTVAGWMYDTVMTNWIGVTIQTTSHASTPCEHVETLPYKSFLTPTGVDSVLASPDKHGNYLTKGGCNTSFICNPGCNNNPSKKNVKPVNIGEEFASLVPDLGTYYPAYAGEDPWSTNDFLGTQGGSAGAIRDKMLKSLSSDFIQGSTLTQPQICPIYEQCFGVSGSAYMDYTCAGNSYNFWGQQLTVSGSYQHIVTNSYGCDSTITLNLAFLNSDTTFIIASVCNGYSYNFNGHLLNTPGFFVDTLLNVGGCDSIVALELTILPVDSTYLTDYICPGGIYNFFGQVLTSAGTYTNNFTNVYSCDSVLILTLLQDSPEPIMWPWASDTIFITNGPVQLLGATPIGGEYSGHGVYNGIFYPDSAGLGPQTITYTYTDSLGCSGSLTRDCAVLYSGLNDFKNNDLVIYPVPAENVLFVQSARCTSISVFNAQGQSISPPVHYGLNSAVISVESLPNGLYWLLLNSDKQQQTRRFLVAH